VESYQHIDGVCGRLVHEVPLDNKYINTQVQWASQKLASFALDSLIAERGAEAMNLVLSAQGLGSYGSLRGDLFEKLAHRIVSAGGTFTVRDLVTGLTSTESFKEHQVFHFKEIREVKKDHYNIPRSKNFATIDSLVPPNQLFQMTVSLSHTINEKGLNNLNLPDGLITFYFVTPGACVEAFKMAKLGEEWRERIKQKVIKIELSKEIMERHGNKNDEIIGWGLGEDDEVVGGDDEVVDIVMTDST